MFHEDDGGQDDIGTMRQDGRSILRSYSREPDSNRPIYDDLSGKDLVKKLVKEANALELKYFREMGVYEYVDRSELQRSGGKLIGTRWVIFNTGDEGNPDIRARLVGKKFRTSADDSLYASTPPLEALRLLISTAATRDGHDPNHHQDRTLRQDPDEAKCVMISDVRRAYLFTHARHATYLLKYQRRIRRRRWAKLRSCACVSTGHGTRQ